MMLQACNYYVPQGITKQEHTDHSKLTSLSAQVMSPTQVSLKTSEVCTTVPCRVARLVNNTRGINTYNV